MANMTTRPIASAAERIAASTYLWGHTGSGPATDRRIAATDIPMKDATGKFNISVDFGIGAAPDSRFRVLSAAGTASLRIGFNNTSVNFFDGDTHHFRSGSASPRIIMDGLAGIRPAIDGNENAGSAAFRFNTIFAVTGTINTSDERAKTDIGDIPDEWLDAWAGVQWQRFKMKGGNRWHVGLVAQQVHAVFAAHNIDAFEIGLCCFDSWDEVTEPILKEATDDDGNIEYVDTGKTRIVQSKGDRWGLRYDECQAIEAAWQRREVSRLTVRLAALESPVT